MARRRLPSDLLDTAAEGVGMIAEEAGERIGLPKGARAVQVLEVALAQKWADAALWRGENDTPERLNEAIRIMQQRMADHMRMQHYLRRGSKPS